MSELRRVFHSTCDLFRKQINVILVRPEEERNVGAAARALANMDIRGSFRLVGGKRIINEECRRIAKHAVPLLDSIEFYETLEEALRPQPLYPSLSLAATARIGSSHRPHPVLLRHAAQRAIDKLRVREVGEINLVFGPEGSGLTNKEVKLCDWVVTIPSSSLYRSLNLAQAVLISTYELNMELLYSPKKNQGFRPSQKQKLISHFVALAEEVGFLLPGDPYKMRPRMEEILSHLPNHIKDVKTLHGLIDQVIRTVRKGRKDIKGRFKRLALETQIDLNENGIG